MEDSRLNKAAKLAAEEDVLLNSDLSAGIKVALAKPLSHQVRSSTKRVRQPGMTATTVAGVGAPDEEEDLSEALIFTLLKQMIKGCTPSTPAVGKIPGKATGTPKGKSVKKLTTPSGFPRPIRPRKVAFETPASEPGPSTSFFLGSQRKDAKQAIGSVAKKTQQRIRQKSQSRRQKKSEIGARATQDGLAGLEVIG